MMWQRDRIVSVNNMQSKIKNNLFVHKIYLYLKNMFQDKPDEINLKSKFLQKHEDLIFVFNLLIKRTCEQIR